MPGPLRWRYTPKTEREYLLQCDSGGTMYLVDGLTGEILNSVSLESTIEASPAVFDDIAVVGSRGEKIYGIKLK